MSRNCRKFGPPAAEDGPLTEAAAIGFDLTPGARRGGRAVDLVGHGVRVRRDLLGRRGQRGERFFGGLIAFGRPPTGTT